jgi:hypothetical protein
VKLGVTATNDEAESVLGGTTASIQQFGRINLSNASAVSDAKRNAFFNRSKKSRPGLFHSIDEDIRQIIVSIAMEDAPNTIIMHQAELDVQANARRMKEELIKQKNIEKATEEYIDALYYHAMYSSAACWKGDPKIVSVELSKLKTQTAKYNAVKENIQIRVKGFGWEWCKHAWSKNGKKYTTHELAKWLQHIIRKEKTLEIPSEPPLHVPTRTNLPALGTPLSLVKDLDKKYLDNEDEIKRKAEDTRKSREKRGEGSMHSQLQPFSRPDVDSLIDQRIDVLFSIDIDNCTKALRWCQGRVIDVVSDTAVEVEWDPAPDIEGYEESTVSECVLLPSKWNKDNKEGAWRLDIDIEEHDEEDDLSDEEEELAFVE